MTILKHQKLLLNYCCRARNGSRSRPYMTSLTYRKNIHVRREALKNLIQRSWRSLKVKEKGKKEWMKYLNPILNILHLVGEKVWTTKRCSVWEAFAQARETGRKGLEGLTLRLQGPFARQHTWRTNHYLIRFFSNFGFFSLFHGLSYSF